jgi:hypothetical protein
MGESGDGKTGGQIGAVTTLSDQRPARSPTTYPLTSFRFFTGLLCNRRFLFDSRIRLGATGQEKHYRRFIVLGGRPHGNLDRKRGHLLNRRMNE